MHMRNTYRALVIILISCVAGCSSTGGSIGNLVPAPKFLKGKVNGDTYYAINSAFKVTLPHPPSKSEADSYEWSYTKVREGVDGPLTSVSFGPAALDYNEYYVDFINKKIHKAFTESGPKILHNVLKHSRPGFVNLKQDFIKVRNYDAIYSVYKSDKVIALLTVIDFKDCFSTVGAIVPLNTLKTDVREKQIDMFVKRQWGLYNNFYNSLEPLKCTGN